MGSVLSLESPCDSWNRLSAPPGCTKKIKKYANDAVRNNLNTQTVTNVCVHLHTLRSTKTSALTLYILLKTVTFRNKKQFRRYVRPICCVNQIAADLTKTTLTERKKGILLSFFFFEGNVKETLFGRQIK